MPKPNPLDPATQFICDGCGRTYNFSQMEDAGGKELCEACYASETGIETPKPGSPEAVAVTHKRAVRVAAKRVDQAQAKLKEALDAQKAAAQAQVPVPVQGAEEEVDGDEDGGRASVPTQ